MSNAVDCSNFDISEDFCNHYCDRYYHCDMMAGVCGCSDCKHCINSDFVGTKCLNFSKWGDDLLE